MKKPRGFSLLESLLVIIVASVIIVAAVRIIQSHSATSLLKKTAAQYQVLLDATLSYSQDSTTPPSPGSDWGWLQQAGYLSADSLSNQHEIYNAWHNSFSLESTNNNIFVVSSRLPTAELASSLAAKLSNGYVENDTTVKAFVPASQYPYMKNLVVQNIPVYIAKVPYISLIRDKCSSGYENQVSAEINTANGSSISHQLTGNGGYANSYRLEVSWWGENSDKNRANYSETYQLKPIIYHIQANESQPEKILKKDGKTEYKIDKQKQVAHNIYLGFQIPALQNIDNGAADHIANLMPMLMNGSYDEGNNNDPNQWDGNNSIYFGAQNGTIGNSKSTLGVSDSNTSTYLIRLRYIFGYQGNYFIYDCTPSKTLRGSTLCQNIQLDTNTRSVKLSDSPWLLPTGQLPTTFNASENYQATFFGMLTVRTWCQSVSGDAYPQWVIH